MYIENICSQLYARHTSGAMPRRLLRCHLHPAGQRRQRWQRIQRHRGHGERRLRRRRQRRRKAGQRGQRRRYRRDHPPAVPPSRPAPAAPRPRPHFSAPAPPRKGQRHFGAGPPAARCRWSRAAAREKAALTWPGLDFRPAPSSAHMAELHTAYTEREDTSPAAARRKLGRMGDHRRSRRCRGPTAGAPQARARSSQRRSTFPSIFTVAAVT